VLNAKKNPVQVVLVCL